MIGLLKRALWERGNPPAVIAVIDGPERIEAAVCLDAIQHWYSDTWFYCDRFLYVHPLHRRSRHAVRLMKFVLWWQEMQQCPVVLSIESFHRTDRKIDLYRRYGRQIGGSFLIGKLPIETVPTPDVLS